ncbi:MAG: RNA polymerase sigma factor [Bacteroidota bacterium]|nr:RNA polymerase sigma factor [Bacteroidota bacterium]
MSNEDEARIIEKAKAGDNAAIKQLVDEYAPVIFRFSYNICRNQDRAEHATQETFLSILKKLNQFDNRSKFSTWLYTIVSNHCLMLARSEKTRRHMSLDDDENTVPEIAVDHWEHDPEASVERADLKEHLDDAIDKLAPEYKVIFVLRDIEGLSTEEVSNITNLSVPAVKSRLHRARAFLRSELTPIFKERDHE